MTTRLKAGAPLGVLVTKLRRAGWGDLAGPDTRGVRAALQALADLLPGGIASGRVTAPQLAATAGYSERWMRSRLTLLEDVGVITWTRGGVVAGVPVPSLVCVHKKVLLSMIMSARQLRDAMLARYRMAQRERVAGLVNTIRRKARSGKPAGQPHAELTSGLPPIGEGTRKDPAPPRRIETTYDVGSSKRLKEQDAVIDSSPTSASLELARAAARAAAGRYWGSR